MTIHRWGTSHFVPSRDVTQRHTATAFCASHCAGRITASFSVTRCQNNGLSERYQANDCIGCFETFWKRFPRFLANLRFRDRSDLPKISPLLFSSPSNRKKLQRPFFDDEAADADADADAEANLSFITFDPHRFFYQRLSNFDEFLLRLFSLTRFVDINQTQFWTRCVRNYPSFRTSQTLTKSLYTAR